MKKKYAHVGESNVAPDASSGVVREARNEALRRASAEPEHSALTRRCAPRGGRGVRPYKNGVAETA
ncbi:MAG TPA: hypothetical protein VF123_00370 [Candidatus Sulfotelmatobacter sp.]